VLSEANSAGDVRTRKSMSGVVTVYAGSAVAWSSQLQQLVALCTTEAEFIAASEGAKEPLWLKHLLGELGENCSDVTTLYIDNASTVKLAKNAKFHKQLKHVEVRYYSVLSVTRMIA
jgi:hypothetical protein